MRILSNDYLPNVPGESDVANGGPAAFAHAFSRYVVRHGHEWMGLVNRHHAAPEPRIRKIASAGRRAYYACYLPGDRIRLSMTSEKRLDPRAWFAGEIETVRRFVRRTRPDILFLNGFSLYAWILLESASRENVPVVIQHAGIARIEFDLHKHLYSRAGRAMMLQMERDIVSLARTQIFLNEYSRDVFSSVVCPVPAAQSRVIPLPYFQAYEDAGASGRGKTRRNVEVVIGCVARWDRIKNHRAVLRLAWEARRRGLPWTFKTVAAIPASAINRRFEDSYRRAIEVVAPMGRDALADFYESVDLLVLPSRFDVSPSVVMEAALMGKPTLIAPGVGWNSEYGANGMADWITNFSDAGIVVETILRLLASRRSRRFENMVRNVHAPEVVFGEYLRVFGDRERREGGKVLRKITELVLPAGLNAFTPFLPTRSLIRRTFPFPMPSARRCRS